MRLLGLIGALALLLLALFRSTQAPAPVGTRFAMAEALLGYELSAEASYLANNLASAPIIYPYLVTPGAARPIGLPADALARLSSGKIQFLPLEGSRWPGRLSVGIGEPRSVGLGCYIVRYFYECGPTCGADSFAVMAYVGGKWYLLTSVRASGFWKAA